MDLSIVTTLYHAAPCLEEFYAWIRASAEEITDHFKIIFVDSGSPDNSLDTAIALCYRDVSLRINGGLRK